MSTAAEIADSLNASKEQVDESTGSENTEISTRSEVSGEKCFILLYVNLIHFN